MYPKNLPTLRELYAEERDYTYSHDDQFDLRAGLIGHLRADFGGGNEFHSTWWPHAWDKAWNDQDFKDDIDRVVNGMRRAEFKKRSELSKYCYNHPEASFGDGRNYGIRIDTDDYSYLFRLDPNPGVYNIYCYCYKTEYLNKCLAGDEGNEN